MTLSATSALAAQIRAKKFGGDTPGSFISVVGDIKDSDLARFRTIALAHDEAVVWLDSDGGSVLEAIEIGKLVRIRGYATYVAGGSCNSACALIWLAGSPRLLDPEARIGFHASYTEADGKRSESGAGNALVGGYLASLELGPRAILFATLAGPDTMKWLDVDNAEEAGIKIEVLERDADEVDEPPKVKAASPTSGDESASLYAEVGGWLVKIDHTLEDNCFLLAGYDDGVYLRVGVMGKGEDEKGYMIVAGENWKSLRKGQTYKIGFQLGDAEAWEGDFEGMELHGLKGVVITFKETEVFKEFASAADVSFTYKGKEIDRLGLKDSDKAMKELIACQAKGAVAKDPFAR